MTYWICSIQHGWSLTIFLWNLNREKGMPSRTGLEKSKSKVLPNIPKNLLQYLLLIEELYLLLLWVLRVVKNTYLCRAVLSKICVCIILFLSCSIRRISLLLSLTVFMIFLFFSLFIQSLKM
jgi:hypothetical protein